jgi:hypothetical protein
MKWKAITKVYCYDDGCQAVIESGAPPASLRVFSDLLSFSNYLCRHYGNSGPYLPTQKFAVFCSGMDVRRTTDELLNDSGITLCEFKGERTPRFELMLVWDDKGGLFTLHTRGFPFFPLIMHISTEDPVADLAVLVAWGLLKWWSNKHGEPVAGYFRKTMRALAQIPGNKRAFSILNQQKTALIAVRESVPEGVFSDWGRQLIA